MRTISYTIDFAYSGIKIQDYLRRAHGYSSRTIVKLKHYSDGIMLNGTHAKTVEVLSAGDTLAVTFREGERGGVSHIIRSNKRVQTVYDDADLMVYNKPPFMPVHPSCGHVHDTLCNVFSTYCDSAGTDLSFRPVNRLDRDTSGAVIVAKSRHAAAKLVDSCTKVYLAVAVGVPQPLAGTIDMPIARLHEREMLRGVSPDGQASVTHYRVMQTANGHSLVRLALETGRTHQIRVHMAAIGYPLLGDSMYGSASELIGRQLLHCGEVRFLQPVSGEPVICRCPFPEDISSAMAALGFDVCDTTAMNDYYTV